MDSTGCVCIWLPLKNHFSKKKPAGRNRTPPPVSLLPILTPGCGNDHGPPQQGQISKLSHKKNKCGGGEKILKRPPPQKSTTTIFFFSPEQEPGVSADVGRSNCTCLLPALYFDTCTSFFLLLLSTIPSSKKKKGLPAAGADGAAGAIVWWCGTLFNSMCAGRERETVTPPSARRYCACTRARKILRRPIWPLRWKKPGCAHQILASKINYCKGTHTHTHTHSAVSFFHFQSPGWCVGARRRRVCRQ